LAPASAGRTAVRMAGAAAQALPCWPGLLGRSDHLRRLECRFRGRPPQLVIRGASQTAQAMVSQRPASMAPRCENAQKRGRGAAALWAALKGDGTNEGVPPAATCWVAPPAHAPSDRRSGRAPARYAAD